MGAIDDLKTQRELGSEIYFYGLYEKLKKDYSEEKYLAALMEYSNLPEEFKDRMAKKLYQSLPEEKRLSLKEKYGHPIRS
jgi:hypothetical protein